MQKQVCSYFLMVHKKLQSLSGVNYVIKTQKSNSFPLFPDAAEVYFATQYSRRTQGSSSKRDRETHTESFASVTGDCAGQSFYS
jgi:hypothetical protein